MPGSRAAEWLQVPSHHRRWLPPICMVTKATLSAPVTRYPATVQTCLQNPSSAAVRPGFQTQRCRRPPRQLVAAQRWQVQRSSAACAWKQDTAAAGSWAGSGSSLWHKRNACCLAHCRWQRWLKEAARNATALWTWPHLACSGGKAAASICRHVVSHCSPLAAEQRQFNEQQRAAVDLHEQSLKPR